MLGALKPRGPQRPEDARAYQRAHCATCVGLRARSWPATLTLTREATLLTLFGLSCGAAEEGAREGAPARAACTALPLLRRDLAPAPGWLLELSAAFSVLTAACALRDAERDGERALRGRLLGPLVRPHLAWALGRLGVSAEAVERATDPVGARDLSSYLAAHHAPIGGVWAGALAAASGGRLSAEGLRPLGEALCDVMLLSDALDDLERDARAGAPNPLLGLPSHERARRPREARAAALAALAAALAPLGGGADPWAGALRACLAAPGALAEALAAPPSAPPSAPLSPTF